MTRIALSIVALAALVHCCDAAWLTTAEGKRVFVRGLAYSATHPKEGADLSASTRALDRRLIRNLRANCLIPLGQTSSESVTTWYEDGILCIPTVPYKAEQMTFFINGQPAPVPAYLDPANRKGLYAAARDLGSAFKGNPGVLAVSLGNNFAWSGFSGDLQGFGYGGFDEGTVAAFQETLARRFGSLDHFNQLTGSDRASFSEVLPPLGLTPAPDFHEWWLFMRDGFAEFLKQGSEGLQAVGINRPSTYQEPTGVRWDPASERVRLPFADLVSANVFYKDARSWLRYCVTLDQVIAGAHGRPVLLTETGVDSLIHTPERQQSILTRSVAFALLHPELAGIGLYEYCDDWQRGGDPKTHSDRDDREHWGLVDGYRAPKPLYRTAVVLMSMLERNDQRLQEWQSPPEVLVSRQDLDWWKLRGPSATRYEDVADQLYRLGVSFHLADVETLLALDPVRTPRLVVCDTFLSVDPDGSNNLAGHLVSYVENGGELLYLCSRPWQVLYGNYSVPEELQVPADRSPVVRQYGKGRCTLVPRDSFTGEELSYYLADFLAGSIEKRRVRAVLSDETPTPVYWRVFEDRDECYLLVVNPAEARAPRLTLKLASGVSLGKVRILETDGCGLVRRGQEFSLESLNSYVMVALGPRAQPLLEQ